MFKILLESTYSFIGSLGFCVLFNIRDKNLITASFGGGLGWFTYKFLLLVGISSNTNALFIATIVISIYSEIMARVLKQPVTIFVIASMIPLVPGSGMYYTTFEAVKGNVSKSVHLGLQTLYSAGAVAIGIVLVSTIARIMKKKKAIAAISNSQKK